MTPHVIIWVNFTDDAKGFNKLFYVAGSDETADSRQFQDLRDSAWSWC